MNTTETIIEALELLAQREDRDSKSRANGGPMLKQAREGCRQRRDYALAIANDFRRGKLVPYTTTVK
jgi:hypothetical protein